LILRMVADVPSGRNRHLCLATSTNISRGYGPVHRLSIHAVPDPQAQLPRKFHRHQPTRRITVAHVRQRESGPQGHRSKHPWEGGHHHVQSQIVMGYISSRWNALGQGLFHGDVVLFTDSGNADHLVLTGGIASVSLSVTYIALRLSPIQKAVGSQHDNPLLWYSVT
jgi:hypothetical protein